MYFSVIEAKNNNLKDQIRMVWRVLVYNYEFTYFIIHTFFNENYNLALDIV